MNFKKIVSMSDLGKNKNVVNGDGGPEACLTGSCPTIYETDTGDFIVQGFILNNNDKEKLGLPKNEDAVVIPKALIDKFRSEYDTF